MLWAIIVILSTFWCIGLMIGHTLGSFIHILIAAVIVLLLISVKQEVSIHNDLKRIPRSRRYKKVNQG
jgi:hypothetical protein